MTPGALRLSRWLGHHAHPASAEATAGSTRLHARRKLFDDIGDFLFQHGLEISDRNFAVVRAYFEGDRAISDRIEAWLRAAAPLTDAMLAELAEPKPNPLAPERMAEMADQLNDKLVECLRIIGQSSASARDYGVAVNSEMQGFEGDPLGTFERLIALTRDVVEATLDLELQLEKGQREIERLRANLMKARREADHDHLTGLPNRRSFETRLGAFPPDPDSTRTMCIALCDIDRFKAINDEHGHDTGDRVLRYFARRLRDALADQAIVARYGGEEFVCLFEQTGIADAAILLDAIRESFAAKPLVNRKTGEPIRPLTFSAGLARVEGDPRPALLAADRALYEAKREGRNRLVIGEAASTH